MITLVEEQSTLAGLPVVRWSRKFREGTVRLTGTLHNAVAHEHLQAQGPIELVFAFLGGEEPRIIEVALSGELRWDDVEGTALVVTEDSMAFDEAEQEASLRMDLLVQALIAQLGDVKGWAEVLPDGEVVVKFQHGVQATIAADAVLTVQGCAAGPPEGLTLSEALTLEVDGEGLRLSHQRFHRLANLARLRIERASLSPDGEVKLHGGANAGLDRLVRGGLHRASARLSELVRKSPKFARVRRFLNAHG